MIMNILIITIILTMILTTVVMHAASAGDKSIHDKFNNYILHQYQLACMH